MRVLVADDDPVYREYLQGLLEEWGFEAVITRDGQAAWEALNDDPSIDLAILDWMMPEPDGFTLCRQIKQNLARENVYVLMLTGSRLKGELIKVVVAGADDYILKPFQPLDLKMRLHVASRILSLSAELEEARSYPELCHECRQQTVA